MAYILPKVRLVFEILKNIFFWHNFRNISSVVSICEMRAMDSTKDR